MVSPSRGLTSISGYLILKPIYFYTNAVVYLYFDGRSEGDVK